uniref:Cip1-interacting zinc finger protein n=2 Tax=Melanaphis sacchari TaxID=742174 RepID=A0A2H8THD2_9HEMI
MKIVKKKVKKPKLNGEVSKSGSGDKTSPRKNENNLLDSRGEPFIKLLCPHCEVTCKTFREYEIHLLKIRHRTAMSQLARKRKHELFMFRQDQRKEQKEIDDKATEEDPKTDINYCKLCQLNFKQPKSDHFSSILHKKIKQFLQPACNVCHLMFASPMRYEHHLCSTNHLKKVDIYDRRTKRMAAVPSADEADGDVDMDNFMVLDSVGSGDDEGSEEGENAQDSKDDGKKKSKSKKEISLGKEFCKKVEVYYCELCKFNLPPHDDVEQQLSLHCRNRVHLQRYVQHCEKNKAQEKTAEVVSKECTDETKSDSDSSNKGVGNEDKNETSDNGDDLSSLNIQHDEEMKNEFDWASLDTVIEVNKSIDDSDNEKSIGDSESK